MNYIRRYRKMDNQITESIIKGLENNEFKMYLQA